MKPKKEISILNEQMAQAVLDGSKTQTRQPLVLPDTAPFGSNQIKWVKSPVYTPPYIGWQAGDFKSTCELDCPFGGHGDVLVFATLPPRAKMMIKSVWAERLNDITTDDAWREGIKAHKAIALLDFIRFWNRKYKAQGYGFGSNSWVWCCEFEVVNDGN